MVQAIVIHDDSAALSTAMDPVNQSNWVRGNPGEIELSACAWRLHTSLVCMSPAGGAPIINRECVLGCIHVF